MYTNIKNKIQKKKFFINLSKNNILKLFIKLNLINELTANLNLKIEQLYC